MTTSKQADFALGIFPHPRQVTYLEGETELSADVRLATSDVLPFIRKTIRSGLSGAGIRVVANKKQFVVSINVIKIEDLNLKDVPTTGLDDYYELSLIDNMVEVRAHSQMGAMWGAQTFAAIFRSFGHGKAIPNLRIRDWSESKYRGFFIETSWGMERVAPDQWAAMMERLLRNKMNTVGINLCGSVGDPASGNPVDMLLIPLPEQDAIRTEIELQWYSAREQTWQEESILPRIFTDDLFRYIAANAREKGLCLIPGFDAVSFARILTSSRSDETLISLRDSAYRDSLYAFCQRLATDYLNGEKGPIVLSFAELSGAGERSAFFGDTPYELEDFLIWFLEKPVSDFFSSLMVKGDLLSGKGARVSPKFIERLKELGLNDKVWMNWEDSSRMDWIDRNAGSESGDFGGHWLSPVLCRNTWLYYRPRFAEIKKSFPGAEQKESFKGVLASGMFDSAYLDHIQFLAQLCWHPWDKSTVQSILSHGALIYGEMAQDYRHGADLLSEAVELPAVLDCSFLPIADNIGGHGYPGSVLERLVERGIPESLQELERGMELARFAIAALFPIAESSKEDLDDFLSKSAGSLLAEAARVEGLCACFTVLLKAGLGEQRKIKPDSQLAEAASRPLLATIEQIETHKPKALVPAVLASFNPLLDFLEVGGGRPGS